MVNHQVNRAKYYEISNYEISKGKKLTWGTLSIDFFKKTNAFFPKISIIIV